MGAKISSRLLIYQLRLGLKNCFSKFSLLIKVLGLKAKIYKPLVPRLNQKGQNRWAPQLHRLPYRFHPAYLNFLSNLSKRITSGVAATIAPSSKGKR